MAAAGRDSDSLLLFRVFGGPFRRYELFGNSGVDWIVPNIHSGQIGIRHAPEEIIYDFFGIAGNRLYAVSEKVVAGKSRNGDKEAGRGGDKHFSDCAGQRRGISDATGSKSLERVHHAQNCSRQT